MRKHIPILFLCLVTFCACRKGDSAPEKEHPRPPFPDLCEGDIALRRGSGLMSRAVLMAGGEQGGYSHIGIVVRDGAQWKVIHAVPGEPDFEGDPDRVKMDDLLTFFGKERAKSGALMRLKSVTQVAETAKALETSQDTSREISARAARKALTLYRRGVRFDHSYDSEDTTRMYCTELIDYVYRTSGVHLGIGRYREFPFPGKKRKVLFPGDLCTHKDLEHIYGY